MSPWQWLNEPLSRYDWRFALGVGVKAAVLFVALNAAFAWADPLPALGRLSVYNALVPGRVRLPYGENPAQSYNLSLYNLEAMLSSQRLARPKAPGEFRVVLLGDSATWGFLLEPEDTLAEQLNDLDLTAASGQDIEFYNLGYPEMSLTKDFLLLDAAMAYQPDLIVWLVTLESFAPERQVENAFIQNNAARLAPLVSAYDLGIDVTSPPFVRRSFLDQTIVGQRREIADWLRLQFYGFTWAATGIDQHIPDDYELRSSDFDEDVTWHAFDEPRAFSADEIAFDVLAAGVDRAGDTPVLVVNEPMFISSGRNSDLRYNFFYPRWAYDRYRTLLADFAARGGLPLLDVWNAIPPEEFTDSPVHMTPEGTSAFAELLAPAIVEVAGAG